MRTATNAYKAVMKELLKPATQIRFRDTASGEYLGLASNDNIDMQIVKNWVVPEDPNYRRYATLDNFGWKVDDASYVCVASNTPITDVTFITKELTPNTDVIIQDHIPVQASQAGTVYLKVAPIDCSTLTIKFGKTNHVGGFAETPQEVVIDGTDMTEFETVSFTVENGSYLLEFNVSEACRISYYPLCTSAEDIAPIFDNSNIISVDVEEYLDLYSQELPRFNVTAKIYDVEGKYDPVNPQGEFSKFVQDYSVRMLIGYDIHGNLETPFKAVLYLNDTPQYENREITLNFTTTKSADNKYVNTLPVISGNPGDPVANKEWHTGTAVINSSGYDSLVTHNEMTQIVYSIYGSGYVNTPNGLNASRAIYSRATTSRFTAFDIVGKNSIKIERKPMLKALIIKQYTNTIPTTYQETVSGSVANSNYKRWSTTNVRPFRMIVNIDADVSDICRIDEISLSGATNMAWSFVNSTDPDSGATTLQFWVYCASYNASGTTTYTLGLSHVRQVTNDVTESVNTEGENMVIDNPFITDSSLLASCGNWVKQVSVYRDYYTFDAIANYLIDVGDWVIIDTAYENGVPLMVTDIKYKLPGGVCTITANRRFSIAASNYAATYSRFATFNGVTYIGFISFALVGYFHNANGNTDVVLVTPSSGRGHARIEVPAIGYDTIVDGNVISISDSMNLTWHCDIADHSTPGIWYTADCMYLGTFANVELAARYLIKQAYAEQGYDVTLEA